VEGRAGAFPVTLALLDLVAAALEAQHTGGPLPTYVLWAANTLMTQRQLRLASAAQQGTIIAAALRVINAALAAGAQAEFVPGAADGSRALSISLPAALVAQALCSHASSYIGAVLPPPAQQVAALLQQQPSSAEAEAVLQVAGGLMELVPPLLAAAAAAPALRAPLLGYLLEEQGGPAARLLTYAALAADTGLATKALRLLAALAEAAAAGGAGQQAPEALAALLPRGGQLAALLADLAEPAYGRCYPELWAQAARVLLAATPALPALLDALLLPSGLRRLGEGGGAQGGGEGGAAAAAKAEGGRAARSVLDGLWALVQAAGEGLAGEAPQACALALQVGRAQARSRGQVSSRRLRRCRCKVLQVGSAVQPPPGFAPDSAAARRQGRPAPLPPWPPCPPQPPYPSVGPPQVAAAMWDSAGEVCGPLDLLRCQPGWWPAVAACLPSPAGIQAAGSAEDREAAAWRLAGRAAAARLMLQEAFTRPRAAAAAGEAAGEAGSGERVVDVPPGAPGQPPASLVAVLPCAGGRRLAALPGHASLLLQPPAPPSLALLRAAGVWPELLKWAPESLLPCLEAAAALGVQRQLLEQLFSSLQAAVLQLGDVAVDGLWGRPQPDMLALAAQLREVGAACGAGLRRSSAPIGSSKPGCPWRITRPHLLPRCTLPLAHQPPHPTPPHPTPMQDAAPLMDQLRQGTLSRAQLAQAQLELAESEQGAEGGCGGSVLLQQLVSRPLGQPLLALAAGGAPRLSAPEYGPTFLFDAGRLAALLGPALQSQLDVADALEACMAAAGCSASAVHAGSQLLQVGRRAGRRAALGAGAGLRLLPMHVASAVIAGNLERRVPSAAACGASTACPCLPACRCSAAWWHPWGVTGPCLRSCAPRCLAQLCWRGRLWRLRSWRMSWRSWAAGPALPWRAAHGACPSCRRRSWRRCRPSTPRVQPRWASLRLVEPQPAVCGRLRCCRPRAAWCAWPPSCTSSSWPAGRWRSCRRCCSSCTPLYCWRCAAAGRALLLAPVPGLRPAMLAAARQARWTPRHCSRACWACCRTCASGPWRR
jgi:hypothetical protein